MTSKSINGAVVDKPFDANTVDPGFTVQITGTLADGVTAYDKSFVSPNLPLILDIPAGSYTATISKLGFSNQPSDLFTVAATVNTIQISVPSDAAKTTVA